MVAQKRKYTLADPLMYQYMKDLHNSFVADLADFNAFDPDFNAAYAQNWQLHITTAETGTKNAKVLAQQRQLTQAVVKAMKNCRRYYNEVKFYVQKAFPEDYGIQKQFGFQEYGSVRLSQPRLVEFMTDLYTAAQKYQTELIAVNFTAAHIAHINTLANELQQANRKQNSYKKSSKTQTRKRINTHNTLWNIAARVLKAGKLIYANNPAKYNCYLLPTPPYKTTYTHTAPANPAN